MNLGQAYVRVSIWWDVYMERLMRLRFPRRYYTEAKVDVTQEIKQRAQQAAQAGADQKSL